MVSAISRVQLKLQNPNSIINVWVKFHPFTESPWRPMHCSNRTQAVHKPLLILYAHGQISLCPNQKYHLSYSTFAIVSHNIIVEISNNLAILYAWATQCLLQHCVLRVIAFSGTWHVYEWDVKDGSKVGLIAVTCLSQKQKQTKNPTPATMIILDWIVNLLKSSESFPMSLQLWEVTAGYSRWATFLCCTLATEISIKSIQWYSIENPGLYWPFSASVNLKQCDIHECMGIHSNWNLLVLFMQYRKYFIR